MSENLGKCHQGCAEMHERVARWMNLGGWTPETRAETIGLISDMEIMIHATTHEIEMCLHDEHYFPRLGWLEELRHVAAMFTALAVGTKKFEDHLRHTVECDHEMANGRDCVCGVTHLRNEMRAWIAKNEKTLSTNRFDIMKGNLVERRAMDVAMCESKHKVEALEDARDEEVAANAIRHIAAHPESIISGAELARRLNAMEESLSNVGVLRNAGWSQGQLDALLDDALNNHKSEHVDRCTCIRCRAKKTLEEQVMHEEVAVEDDAPGSDDAGPRNDDELRSEDIVRSVLADIALIQKKYAHL